MDEQSNPWDLIQPQDAMKRHLGAKQFCQYGLSRIISLLSLAYLLFVGDGLSTQHHRITMADVKTSLYEMSFLQSGNLLPLHSTVCFRHTWGYLCALSLLFRKRPPQSNYPPNKILVLVISIKTKWYFTVVWLDCLCNEIVDSHIY
jgi:hypothetical protein